MPPTNNPKQYQLESQGVLSGPYTAAQLRELAKAGQLRRTDTLWDVSTGTRFVAGNVGGLFPDSRLAPVAARPSSSPTASPAAPAAAPPQPSPPQPSPPRPTAAATAPAPAAPPLTAVMVRDVFISYASRDQPIAHEICERLESEGLCCWIAPRDIVPGSEYAEAIIDGIESSRLMVVVHSSAANDSPHVLREVERAVSKGITVIPFRIENVKPKKSLEFFLSAPHWLDAFTPPFEDHLQRLREVVQSALANAAHQTSLPNGPTNAASRAASPVNHRSSRRPQGAWLAALRRLPWYCLPSAAGALALLLGVWLLAAWLRPDPLESEFVDYQRNVTVGNGSVVFLNKHAPNRYSAWRRLADEGNPVAQLFVGRCYQEGIVVPENQETAIEWLRKSAARENSYAMVAIGLAHEEGQGVPKNNSEALHWFTQAANLGNHTAMRNMASLYADGLQGAPDPQAAFEWHRRGAAAGNPYCMRKLGDYYALGQNVAIDKAESEKWYDKAVAAGDRYLMGKRMGNEFAKHFAAYLAPKATSEAKAAAVAALNARLDEFRELELSSVGPFYSDSEFNTSTTGIDDLPADDPLREVQDAMSTRYIELFSQASMREKVEYTSGFSMATESRVRRLHAAAQYAEIVDFWSRCYRDLPFAKLRKTDEWNSLVAQLRMSVTALLKHGQRPEAESVIASTLELCDAVLKDRPWDWYLKDAYTGFCFETADVWFELGEPQAVQPLLLRSWTVRFRQFGKDELLARYQNNLPRKGQSPPNATDDDKKFFERFATAKEGEPKPNSGMTRFTIPADFSGKEYPFHVYLLTGPRGYQELQDQLRWVEEVRGGTIPKKIRESFLKLNQIAAQNNVDFMELTVYALGAANKDGEKKGEAGDDPFGDATAAASAVDAKSDYKDKATNPAFKEKN